MKKKQKKRLKVGLALSGSGGTKAIAHLSIIQELQKHNVPINIVSGTSAGAIVGAYFCLYGEIEGLIDLLIGSNKKDLIGLIDLNNPKQALFKGKKIENALNELYDGKTFKDLLIPFRCIVTNTITGKTEIIKSGKLSKAVLKSISLPPILPLCKKGKYLYSDGGATEPLPIEQLFDEKCDFVIGVNLYEKNLKAPPNKKISFGLNSVYNVKRIMDIANQTLIKYKLKVLDKKYKNKYFIFSPKTNSSDFFRFDLYKKFLKEGEKEFKKKWPLLEKKLMKKL